MSRLNASAAKGFHTPAPPSSAAIASVVSSYMASIEAPSSAATSSTGTAASSGRKAKQKLKLKVHKASPSNAAAAASTGTATTADAGGNVCRNPFCGAPLESHFAAYCVKKSHCQLYRGLQLHCGSFGSEREQAIDSALDKLRDVKRRRLLRKSSSGGNGGSHGVEGTRASGVEFSIPKRKVPVASPTSASASAEDAVELNKEELRAQRKLQQRMARLDAVVAAAGNSGGQAATSAESSDTEQQNGRKRRLILDLRGDSSGSSNSAATATVQQPPLPSGPPPPIAVVATGSQAKVSASGAPFRPVTPTKVGGIEVIPLGAGRHPSSFGGGSRYVQSGNRGAMDNLRMINPLLRPPSAVARAAPVPPPESVAAVVPPRAAPIDPRRAEYAAARFEVTPSSSPVVAQEPQAAAGNRPIAPAAKRTISASEYMNSRKPQDPRTRGSQLAGDAPPPPSSSGLLQRSSSELSNTPASASFLSGALPAAHSRERTFSRSQSDSDVLHAFSGSSRDSEPLLTRPHHSEARRLSASDHVIDLTSSNSRIPPPARQHSPESSLYARSSSYDGGSSSSYACRDYDSREDAFGRAERSLPFPPRPYSPDRYNDHSYEPEYRRPSSSSSSNLYPQEPHWQRRQEDTSRKIDEPPRAPLYPSPASRDVKPLVSTPRGVGDHSAERASSSSEQHDVSVHPEILPVTFSSHDRFIVNLLSRIASFFPKALAPVLNKTKKPRKMRFYLDYVERVKQLSGSRLEIQVAGGRGVVTVEGREWLVLKGTSTVDLYTQILETLLEQSTAWRKLLEDSKRVYGSAVQRLGRGVDCSESFRRMWRALKVRFWKDFPIERQVVYFRGSKRHHWSFCVGNVEIGSGSHEEKSEALRLANEASMKFLLSLEILSDNQKYSGDRQSEQSERDSERRGSSLPPRATSTRIASRAPPVVAEIVETPDVTVSRVRDDSFSDIADAAFSPATLSEQSAAEEDMDTSDADDSRKAQAAATAAASAAGSATKKNPEGCAFCDMVRLRDPDAKFCMRCKAKQPAARASGLRSLSRSSPPRSKSFDALELLQNGLPTRR